MNNDIVFYAKHRHTTKAYDPNRKISDEDIERVKDLLRYSASSTNAQPWHFILASTEEGKAKVAKSAENFGFNKQSILDASHVVVFASKTDLEEEHLLKVLAQEEKDGRFEGDPIAHKTQMHQGRSFFVNLHKEQFNDTSEWNAQQVYLNIGQFLLGVATLGIDATPMEGVDTDVLDAEFGLKAKGYRSLVVVPIGYRNPTDDYNGNLPKSRLEFDEILTTV